MSTAIVEQKKQLTIRESLEGDAFKNAVAKALPKHLTPDRFIRVALTAMTKTPALKNCDQASFFSALLTLSQMGLEPDGRRAHLIPFKNTRRNCTECQLIIDYKGLAELAMRSGTVSYVHADVVREGDVFDFTMGEMRNHVPHFLRRDADKPADAGEVYAVYALCRFKDGTTKAEVMSMDEVRKVRSKSRAGSSGPWVDWPEEMAKKTAFRRLSKWLPLSPEFRTAIEKDDDRNVEIVNVTGTALTVTDDATDMPPLSLDEPDILDAMEGSADR